MVYDIMLYTMCIYINNYFFLLLYNMMMNSVIASLSSPNKQSSDCYNNWIKYSITIVHINIIHSCTQTNGVSLLFNFVYRIRSYIIFTTNTWFTLLFVCGINNMEWSMVFTARADLVGIRSMCIILYSSILYDTFLFITTSSLGGDRYFPR